MSRDLIIVSSPLNVPVGGFLREYWVLPLVARRLSEHGHRVRVVLPLTSLMILWKHVIALHRSLRGGDASPIFMQYLLESLESVLKRSNYSLDIFVPMESLGLVEGLVMGSSVPPIPAALSRHVALVLNAVRELKVGTTSLKEMMGSTPPIIYVTHETPEALSLGTRIRSMTGGYGAVLIHHIEPYHFGFTAFRESARVRGMLQVLGDALISRVVRGLLRSLRLRLVNSVTPEIVSYRGVLERVAPRALVKVLDPPNVLREELHDKLEYLKCRTSSRPRFLYFGRVSFEKGIVDLLKAWRLIRKALPEAELTVIGSIPVPVGSYIKRFIASNRLLGVRFLGYQPYERIVKEALNSHVLLYPSYADGFSFTVLESVAMGLIVVAYNIPAISYHYKRVPTVIRVAPGDVRKMAEVAIEVASKYGEQCEERLSRGRERITEFLKRYSSWERVAEDEIAGLLRIF